MVDAQFHEDLIAELAAINVVLVKCMSAITVLAKQEGLTAKQFLEAHLHSGEAALAKTDYWSVPKDRQEAVVEKARARLTDIIDTVYRTTGAA